MSFDYVSVYNRPLNIYIGIIRVMKVKALLLYYNSYINLLYTSEVFNTQFQQNKTIDETYLRRENF